MSDGQSHFKSETIDYSTGKTLKGWLLVAKNQSITFNEIEKDKIFSTPSDVFKKVSINNFNYLLLELARIEYEIYDTDSDTKFAYNIREFCGCRINMAKAVIYDL